MRNIPLSSAEDDTLAIDQIDDVDYRNAHGLNKSLLVKFMKSPRHYLAALNEKQEATDSMRMGTALHARLFREDPKNHYAVKKKVDGRTAEGKAYNTKFEASVGNKAVLNEEQDEIVSGMYKSLMKSDRFKKIHDMTTHREMGIFSNYKHPKGDFRIKGMLDGYVETDGLVYDVKSSQDGSFDSFRWDFKRFRYDLQQVHYTNLVAKAGLPFKQFLFVVVENKPPFEVSFYTLSVEQFMKTNEEYKLAMQYFGELHAKQDFDIGYTSETKELTF